MNASALVLLLAAAPVAANDACLARVRAAAERLRPSYPALNDKTVVYELFDSEADFYRAFPEKAWNDSGGRVYALRINRRVCADPPPRAAEEAILAHELGHLASYASRGRIGLLGLAWTQLWAGKDLESQERAMDLEAVSRGKGPGLALFREWLYARVPAAVREEKRRLYFTPEEIRALDRPVPAL